MGGGSSLNSRLRFASLLAHDDSCDGGIRQLVRPRDSSTGFLRRATGGWVVAPSLVCVVDTDPPQGAAALVWIQREEVISMSAFKDHFTTHPSHLFGCAVAALFVIAAIVFSLPVLAIFGALMCGIMMIMMIWMMVGMVAKGRH